MKLLWRATPQELEKIGPYFASLELWETPKRAMFRAEDGNKNISWNTLLCFRSEYYLLEELRNYELKGGE